MRKKQIQNMMLEMASATTALPTLRSICAPGEQRFVQDFVLFFEYVAKHAPKCTEINSEALSSKTDWAKRRWLAGLAEEAFDDELCALQLRMSHLNASCARMADKKARQREWSEEEERLLAAQQRYVTAESRMVDTYISHQTCYCTWLLTATQ